MALSRDGSAYRVVSNSGMDTVMLWPASAVQAPVLQQLFHIFCIPAQYDVQYGWTTPPVPGSNGTPAPLQDANAGALFGLKHDDATDKLLGEKFVRYQPVEIPSAKNVAFFASQRGEQHLGAAVGLPRVVGAQDRRAWCRCTTACMVNGVSYGNPVLRTLWGCVYKLRRGRRQRSDAARAGHRHHQQRSCSCCARRSARSPGRPSARSPSSSLDAAATSSADALRLDQARSSTTRARRW
jgi:hypothetical protein